MLIDEALDVIKARLETIDGLTVTTNSALPIVPPMAVVMDGEIDYNTSMRGGDVTLTFGVTVYVAQSDSDEGLYEARRYLSGHGELSVRAAVGTASSDDDLLGKVNLATGERGESENYITATFIGTTHVPGATAT